MITVSQKNKIKSSMIKIDAKCCFFFLQQLSVWGFVVYICSKCFFFNLLIFNNQVHSIYSQLDVIIIYISVLGSNNNVVLLSKKNWIFILSWTHLYILHFLLTTFMNTFHVKFVYINSFFTDFFFFFSVDHNQCWLIQKL